MTRTRCARGTSCWPGGVVLRRPGWCGPPSRLRIRENRNSTEQTTSPTQLSMCRAKAMSTERAIGYSLVPVRTTSRSGRRSARRQRSSWKPKTVSLPRLSARVLAPRGRKAEPSGAAGSDGRRSTSEWRVCDGGPRAGSTRLPRGRRGHSRPGCAAPVLGAGFRSSQHPDPPRRDGGDPEHRRPGTRRLRRGLGRLPERLHLRLLDLGRGRASGRAGPGSGSGGRLREGPAPLAGADLPDPEGVLGGRGGGGGMAADDPGKAQPGSRSGPGRRPAAGHLLSPRARQPRGQARCPALAGGPGRPALDDSTRSPREPGQSASSPGSASGWPWPPSTPAWCCSFPSTPPP